MFFNNSLRVDLPRLRVTSDGGLVLVPELAERLGMGALMAQQPTDTRRGHNTQFPLATWCDSRYTADWTPSQEVKMELLVNRTM